ncbi:MAG: CBS domain-containing protein [Eggerthellaceae bacterium]|nr:CBS domain-containing protein [Eggerthellaceae bacterium]
MSFSNEISDESSERGLINRIFLKKKSHHAQLSEEDIRDAIDATEELDDDEKRIISEVLDLGETTAAEVMTPRVDAIMIDDKATVRQALDRMRGTGYSRLPVFHDDNDNVIGIVRFKNLVEPILSDNGDACVTDFLEEALFVPESKDVLPLLRQMQMSHIQMAIVVDEHGGTAGIITIEDIIEEVVGEITDETDLHNEDIVEVGAGEWILAGACSLENAAEVGIPVTHNGEYETIAGWLMDTFNCVPQLGDEFEYENFLFKVERVRRRRVSLVRVRTIIE